MSTLFLVLLVSAPLLYLLMLFGAAYLDMVEEREGRNQ